MAQIELRGKIFDGLGAQVQDGRVVVSSDSGLIESVDYESPRGGGTDGERRVLATTGTILPGLVDCHVHLIGARRLDLIEWNLLPPLVSALRCVPQLQALLHAGFTAVRDLGSKAGPALRQAVEEGDLVGPRILTSGRSLAETGGDDDLTVLPVDVSSRLAYSIFCDGPWEARKAVREVVRDGANVIKIYASGSFLQGGQVRRQFSSEEIEAIVAEAHKLGVRVAAHAYKEEAIRAAVEGGVDSIEHGIGLTEEVCELMRKRQVFYVPTLSVYDRLRVTAQGEKARLIQHHFSKDLALARSSGLRVVTGTDYAGVDSEPHGLNYVEAVHLVRAGFTPVEALRAATSVGAACLGLEKTGTIEPGAVADLVVVDGHPDQDISSLAPDRVQHVVQKGRLIR